MVTEFLGAILNGVLTGAGYSLLALGIVIIYKGSRVFNFAQAEFGTVAAWMLYLFQFRVPYPVAMVLAVVVVVGLGLLMERLVVQPLFEAPKVTLLVATVAITLALISIQLWLLEGGSFRSIPRLTDGTAVILFDVPVFWQQLYVLVALAALAGALAFFFNATRWGLAVLAASQEATATNLVGISVRRISALVWGMAALLGAVAGVLLAPVQQTLTPAAITGSFLIFGFVGAVVGGMTSMPGAVLGGLLVGLAQSFAVTYVTKIGSVADNIKSVPEVAVFLVLVVVLAVRPAGLLGKET